MRKIALMAIASLALVSVSAVAEARAPGQYGSNKECSAWRRAGNASSMANMIWAIRGFFQDIEFSCNGELW